MFLKTLFAKYDHMLDSLAIWAANDIKDGVIWAFYFFSEHWWVTMLAAMVLPILKIVLDWWEGKFATPQDMYTYTPVSPKIGDPHYKIKKLKFKIRKFIFEWIL